jgi:uncharacterized membrane protein YccC
MARSLVVSAAAAVLIAAGVGGCTDVGRTVRKVTYPPDFRYVPKDQVDSAMWQMAAAVRELDATLRDDALAEPAKQQRILSLLDRMQTTSDRLDSGARDTNHPLLDRKVPRLSADIQVARIAASDSPPRYALAGSVSGACIYCHFSPLPGERMENPPDPNKRPGS